MNSVILVLIVPVGDQVSTWVSQRRPENSHKYIYLILIDSIPS